MEQIFNLEITASDRQFFKGECEMVVLPAIDGEHGVMAGHESMVVAVRTGEIRFKVNGEWKIAAVSDGFAEIMPEFVTVIVDTAEWPDEIDANRANEAKMRAEERLRQKQSQLEYYHSKLALKKAMNRLRVKGK